MAFKCYITHLVIFKKRLKSTHPHPSSAQNTPSSRFFIARYSKWIFFWFWIPIELGQGSDDHDQKSHCIVVTLGDFQNGSLCSCQVACHLLEGSNLDRQGLLMGFICLGKLAPDLTRPGPPKGSV